MSVILDIENIVYSLNNSFRISVNIAMIVCLSIIRSDFSLKKKKTKV